MASLHEAARLGDTKRISAILSEDPDCDLDVLDASGLAPLHHAVISSKSGVGSYLIDLGASVDVLDRFGNTPLHLAAGANQRLAASMLLRAGASRQPVNKTGDTPLHIAAQFDSAEVAWLIINNESFYDNDGVLSRDAKDASGKTPPEVALACSSSRVLRVFAGEEPTVSSRL
eukprot:TRINITY_DN34631_c0_g1_i1.p1 TRINITY_DN34631_c0_g1~~TRINITY_DN34631_c0_g1_i1.p1  ORF type:complete len:194 (-),score=33.27 TRINITY_DN34631_c0_g1_i1:146-664(-)